MIMLCLRVAVFVLCCAQTCYTVLYRAVACSYVCNVLSRDVTCYNVCVLSCHGVLHCLCSVVHRSVQMFVSCRFLTCSNAV
jgi:hypothetical protein